MMRPHNIIVCARQHNQPAWYKRFGLPTRKTFIFPHPHFFRTHTHINQKVSHNEIGCGQHILATALRNNTPQAHILAQQSGVKLFFFFFCSN